MAVVDKYLIDVRTQGVGKSKKQLGGVTKASSNLAKSVIGLGAAYFTATGLISGVRASIDAFAKQELAQKKLETALGFTSNALIDQARALQQVSMFGDEDIIMMQSMLASFVDSETEIKKLTVATLDLASGMGIDLKNAGDLIAKTIGSSTNALSRYGIQVDGAVGSSERLETLTGNIANLFGGQAKAQSETMMGSMEQMKNAIGDTAEAFGGLLSPAVIGSARVLKGMAESLSNAIDDFDRFMLGGIDVVKILTDQEVAMMKFNKEMANIGDDTEALNKLKDSLNDLFPEAGQFVINTPDLILASQQLEIIEAKLMKLGETQSEIIFREDGFFKISSEIRQKFYLDSLIQKVDTTAKIRELNDEELRNYKAQQASMVAIKLNSVSSMLGAFAQLNSASKGNAKATKRLMQGQAVIDTYASANRALATGVPPFSYIQAAASIAMGLANVIQIENQKFEQGGLIGGRRHSQGGTTIEAEQGEFVMSRNAVNSIGVESLNRMNQGSSGGGSSISININGGMISPDFVENELAESVREAVRRGADFGIS